MEAGFSWSSVAIDLGIHSKIEASNCSARLSVVRGFLTQKGGSFSHLSPRTTVAIGNLEAKLVVRRDRMLQQKLEWQHSQ